MGVADPRIALWLLACPAVFAANIGHRFSMNEIEPGVFVHAGQPLPLDLPGSDDIANIGFIVGAKCVAVIDTGGSVRIGRELRAALRSRTQTPICYVINTHVHSKATGRASWATRPWRRRCSEAVTSSSKNTQATWIRRRAQSR